MTTPTYPTSPNEQGTAPSTETREPSPQPIHEPIPAEPVNPGNPMPQEQNGVPGDPNVPRVFKPWFDVTIETHFSVPVPPPPFPTPVEDPKSPAEMPKTPQRPVP